MLCQTFSKYTYMRNMYSQQIIHIIFYTCVLYDFK